MGEKLTGINGNIIRWAREFYNIEPEDAAEALGVDVERYKKWESGDDYPTYSKLKGISRLYHKPSVLFFFPEPPKLPSIKGDLRTLPDEIVKTFSKNSIIQFEKARVYQLNLQELYDLKESVVSRRESFPKDIEKLSAFFRELLEFPIEAQKARKNPKVVFNIFREKFYDLGIYVFKDAFKDDGISGICLNHERFPVIIINNSMSFARQIFTLFHELYHLISNTSGAEIIRDEFYVSLSEQQAGIERACDTFANSFLIPIDDFTQELKKKPLSEERIEELSNLYSVSKEAIMYKLLRMGKITHQDYDSLKEFFYGDALRNGKRSLTRQGGGNHYHTKLAYLGEKYTGDVFKQYFSGKIDNVRASEMLQSKVDHLANLETVFFRGAVR